MTKNKTLCLKVCNKQKQEQIKREIKNLMKGNFNFIKALLVKDFKQKIRLKNL